MYPGKFPICDGVQGWYIDLRQMHIYWTLAERTCYIRPVNDGKLQGRGKFRINATLDCASID